MGQKLIPQEKDSIWKSWGPKILLAILLLVFSAYTLFLAVKLDTGIVPDEPYRFTVSRSFSTTWGIPEYVPATNSAGDNLHRNPFLGYWIFGRALNVFNLFAPAATSRQQIVFLRIFNAIISMGTVFFTYLISKELIKNKWLQVLPVFMLTNTLMFVFLSGGVSYDNPAILACTIGIYFLVRVFNNKDFTLNSLGFLISIAIACQIKYSILPLALAVVIAWLVYILIHRKQINIRPIKKAKTIALVVILLIFIGFNIAIYGVNLVKFQSLIPDCQDTFPLEVCQSSTFGIRYQEMALSEKLTLLEALKQGHPDPIRYFFDEWIREMLKRIFGIMGHKNYFPIVVSYFHIAFYWLILLGFRYIKKPSFKTLSLVGIFGFYSFVLIYMNYDSELVYGFNKYVALQGRYIFPVIAIAYVMISHILSKVSNKLIKIGTICLLVLLFLYGGPIRFIWYYNSVFADWFI